MSRKIAILEFDYHAEVLNNTLKILAQTDFKVLIFTKQKISGDVQNDKNNNKFEWYIKEKKTSLRRFIKQNLETINNCDIIIFNTLASHFRLFLSIRLKPLKILRIHNAYAYLIPGKTFKPVYTSYFIWKDFSHIVRKTIGELDWYFRRKFLHEVDYLCFPDEKIDEYAHKSNIIKDHKTTPALPLASYDPSFEKTRETEEVYITIPGTIDQRRRNYELVFNAINHLDSKLNRKVILTLLGRPKDHYGQKILSRCKKIKVDKLEIKYFTKRVPFDIFDDVLRNTDFLILPIIIATKYVIYKEEYGYTKISGSINDLIHYGKPALVNKDYPLNERLKPITSQFANDKELANKILEWINKKKYIEHGQQASKSLDFYSLKNLPAYYSRVLNKLIEKKD